MILRACRLQNSKKLKTATNKLRTIVLYNLCNEFDDLCQLRWKFEVEYLALIWKQLHREVYIKEFMFNHLRISDWIWMDH